MLATLAGCGSEKDAVMPDVTGNKLDIAKSAIADAGVSDEVKVDGGGRFGVITESNWEVCAQSPAAGAVVGEAPRLTVDRTCDDVAATSKAGATRADADGDSDAAQPAAADPSEVDAVLSRKDNDELSALLKVSDPCDETVASFAAKYGGRKIEFNGSIKDKAPHGDTKTRYDILISAGNKGPESTIGPDFKYEDVNVFDLNLAEANRPDTVGEGDRFLFVAKIGEFNPGQCLLFLDPVSTRAR
jgi:hypothetical protein